MFINEEIGIILPLHCIIKPCVINHVRTINNAYKITCFGGGVLGETFSTSFVAVLVTVLQRFTFLASQSVAVTQYV